jgi:hypothetical protein
LVVFPFLLGLVAVLAGPGWAQTGPTPAPRAGAGAAVPATPADPKAERKIPGLEWARKDGRWLGLTREGDHLTIRFYDEKKKPEKADLASASAHWKAPLDTIETHAVLNPSKDSMSLMAPQLLKLPLTYPIRLTLFLANGAEGESFMIVAKPAMDPLLPKSAAAAVPAAAPQ